MRGHHPDRQTDREYDFIILDAIHDGAVFAKTKKKIWEHT